MGNSSAMPFCCKNRRSLEHYFWDEKKDGCAEGTFYDYMAD